MSLKYLSNIPNTTRRYASRNANNIPLARVNKNNFKNSFFRQQYLSGLNLTWISENQGRLFQFIKTLENSVLCRNTTGIKYLIRLRLRFSHLRNHKFNHGFQDVIDLLYICSTANENTVHYFLHCPNFSIASNTFLNEIAGTDKSIIDQDKKTK